MNLPSTLRRHGAAALLAFAAAIHLPATAALELPGAAPQAPAVLPDYASVRVNAFFQTRKNEPMALAFARLDKIDTYLAALRVHAGNPAPRFNSEAQRIQARSDVVLLANALARITATPDISPELLLRAGIALSLADNLGAAEASALADARFTRLLALTPANGEALYEYGVHLVNTGRPSDAQAPLRSALAKGNAEARWPLALSLAALGQRDAAIAELDALQAASPAAAQRYPLAATLASWRATPN